MLFAYGAVILAAVPFHQHSQIDVEQTQHTSTQTSHDCGVCSFAAVSMTPQYTLYSVLLIEYAERIYFVDYFNELSSVFTKEYPRRGPPAGIS